MSLDTPEQKAARELFFERELPALRRAIQRLEKNRQGVTELSILLLLMDLPERERRAVFGAIVDTMAAKRINRCTRRLKPA